MTQNNLGIALAALGMRDPGSTYLEEAVTVYRAALTERTRERVPLDWAVTQNNLGIALQTLGEREGGTLRLEAAVAAYKAALSAKPYFGDTVGAALAQVEALLAERSKAATTR